MGEISIKKKKPALESCSNPEMTRFALVSFTSEQLTENKSWPAPRHLQVASHVLGSNCLGSRGRTRPTVTTSQSSPSATYPQVSSRSRSEQCLHMSPNSYFLRNRNVSADRPMSQTDFYSDTFLDLWLASTLGTWGLG